jgi:hypothetical protein
MFSTIQLTRDEIAEYVQVSKTPFNDKQKELLITANLNEIRPLLGERLFDAVASTPESYEALLNGGAYEYNGVTYQNYGLKAVLAHYYYAYNAMYGDAVDTPFGQVNKLNGNLSQPLEYNFKKNMFQVNKQKAFSIWQTVEAFLIRTNEPLFKKCGFKRNGNFNISKI